MKNNELDMNELLFVMSKCGYYNMTSDIKGISVADNSTYLHFWNNDNYVHIIIGSFDCIIQVNKKEYDEIPFDEVVKLLKDELNFINK